MKWLGMLAGFVLLVALVGGVGTMAYQAGLDASGTAQVVQTAPVGAEGGTVIVRGMYGYGHGYGYGNPFGFLHFIVFILFVGFIFKMFAFGFRGGHRGGWGGGHGGWEEQARRRHDEWHAGSAQGTEPPSTAAGA